ncbi:MAG: alkaline phosphatase D family protein, partial [Beijerinckiaceae bacterium]
MLDQRVWATPVFRFFPFPLGVASGEPAADGFVIWTKLSPEPLRPDGGLPMKAIPVQWEVATDPQMRQIAAKGEMLARPELGHAVHVEVGGLTANRDYYYRFTAGTERSMTGRSRTLPPVGASLDGLKFAVAGCQRYEDGHFTAFRHLAEERFDVVFHYGDYIYEYRALRPGDRPAPVVRVMPDLPHEIYALTDYRHRYALYKLDTDLQRAHASAPFIMSFDDHEVDNNWAGEVSEEEGIPAEIFMLRRVAAFQAWYEFMPLRRSSFPRGPVIDATRRFAYGDLASFNVLDTRQFRTDQPCGDGAHAKCEDALKPEKTMLGEKQEKWLHDGFRESRQRWNILAQQVMVMRHDRDPSATATGYHMDKWDGAVAGRNRLFDAIEETKLANPVVLTGDIHQNWAGDLKRDFDDVNSKTLGSEFVATSITSGGDGAAMTSAGQNMLNKNKHIKYFNNQRGYVRHVLTKDRWQADYRVMDKVSTPDGKVSTAKSFVIEAGQAGLKDG